MTGLFEALEESWNLHDYYLEIGVPAEKAAYLSSGYAYALYLGKQEKIISEITKGGKS